MEETPSGLGMGLRRPSKSKKSTTAGTASGSSSATPGNDPSTTFNPDSSADKSSSSKIASVTRESGDPVGLGAGLSRKPRKSSASSATQVSSQPSQPHPFGAGGLGGLEALMQGLGTGPTAGSGGFNPLGGIGSLGGSTAGFGRSPSDELDVNALLGPLFGGGAAGPLSGSNSARAGAATPPLGQLLQSAMADPAFMRMADSLAGSMRGGGAGAGGGGEDPFAAMMRSLTTGGLPGGGAGAAGGNSTRSGFPAGVGFPPVGGGMGDMGGLDLGRMMQEMMPMVAPMMGPMLQAMQPGGRGAAARQKDGRGWKECLSEAESQEWSRIISADASSQMAMPAQRPFSDAYLRLTRPAAGGSSSSSSGGPSPHTGHRGDAVAEALQAGRLPSVVVREVVRAAGKATDLEEEVVERAANTAAEDSELVEMYMQQLKKDLKERFKGDPDAKDRTKYPACSKALGD